MTQSHNHTTTQSCHNTTSWTHAKRKERKHDHTTTQPHSHVAIKQRNHKVKETQQHDTTTHGIRTTQPHNHITYRPHDTTTTLYINHTILQKPTAWANSHNIYDSISPEPHSYLPKGRTNRWSRRPHDRMTAHRSRNNESKHSTYNVIILK